MEKSESELLKEKLFDKKEVGWKKTNEKQKEEIFKFADEYIYYLNKCKTEREAVNFTTDILFKNGFKKIEDCEDLKPGDKIFYSNRGKSLYVAVIGEDNIKSSHDRRKRSGRGSQQKSLKKLEKSS